MYRFLSTTKKILDPNVMLKNIFFNKCNLEDVIKNRENINNYIIRSVKKIEMSESHSTKPFYKTLNYKKK